MQNLISIRQRVGLVSATPVWAYVNLPSERTWSMHMSLKARCFEFLVCKCMEPPECTKRNMHLTYRTHGQYVQLTFIFIINNIITC